jgi:hypothetical protein
MREWIRKMGERLFAWDALGKVLGEGRSKRKADVQMGDGRISEIDPIRWS